MADTLTRIEALEFIEGVLQIQFPVDKLREDRVGFLNDVINAFQKTIPFQSVTAIATPKPERRKLTFAEVKVNMLTRQGGICYEMNHFMKALLESLGYDVHHVSFNFFGIPNNHMATVLRGLIKQDDLHLIDVGHGYPMFRSIPLDFDKESPLYHSSILTHKFVKDADGALRWMHKAHLDYIEAQSVADVVDGWYTLMVSNLEFRDIEFFAASMENVHTVEDGPGALAPHLVTLRAVDYRNNRLLAIKDTTILEEDETGRLHKKHLSRPEELFEAYRTYFPQFSKEIIQQALQTNNPKFDG